MLAFTSTSNCCSLFNKSKEQICKNWLYISIFINNPIFHPNRFRPPGLFVKESNVLHQEDGGALPGGGATGHPEPSPNVQL